MPLVESIIQKMSLATRLYYRLIILVGATGTGKTRTLQDIHRRTGVLLVNVNLELSRRLLELTERQRALQLPRILSEIVNTSNTDAVLLDNIEMLFDPSLKQDPLRLLQGLSRNKTLVVAWNGSASSGYLTCAAPEHPEYRRYPIRDLLIVSLENVKS